MRWLEQTRSRLRKSIAEPPILDTYAPLIVLWRFPHLEPINHSWAFLVSTADSSGVLRIASWDQFGAGWGSKSEPIRIADSFLETEEILEALEVFGRFQIFGDQRGGIYDGPRYGRDLYCEKTREVIDSAEWIHGDTFRALGSYMSDSLKRKMQWPADP